jgi:hypothetical protein
VGLHNRAIDSRGEAEVVRIDNEPPQAASLATRRAFERFFPRRVYSTKPSSEPFSPIFQGIATTGG